MWLTDFTVDVGELYYDYINLNVIPSGSAPSDQWYFWEFGYDGVFYHEYEFNYYYHTSQDTIENMNITYAIKCSKLVLATLTLIAEIANFPPNAPTITGPAMGANDIEYDYSFICTDPDDEDVYFFIDWGDDNIDEWIGPAASGEEYIVSHMWSSPGEYELKAKAKDINNYEGEWSTIYLVTIVESAPPNVPIITGTTQGKPGESYNYYFKSIDPEGDDVSYYIEWGDGEGMEWSDFQTSGAIFKENHEFSEKGTFTIKAKSKDIYGVKSDWGTLEVTMPRNIISFNTIIQRLFERFTNAFLMLRQILL
jgi:hypothetical protein